MDEIRPMMTTAMTDSQYIADIAHTKRFLELWTSTAAFRQATTANPEAMLAKYKLNVRFADMQILCDRQASEGITAAELPLIVRRYRAFITEKLTERTAIRDKYCVPLDPVFKTWRARQIARCWGEFGLRHDGIIHAPITFELTKGCSVGCPFCGLGAGKLEKVFAYTPDNARLWQSVLAEVKAIVGDGAGWGTCYFGSEPLDNPDYERFCQDFKAVLGKFPQTTTALSLKDAARTKGLLALSEANNHWINRFSVLTQDMFEKVLATFTPEELVYVELLQQYPESDSKLVKSGRARTNTSRPDVEASEGNTIACLSGFVVNMAERSLRLVTPCGASDRWPEGQWVLGKAYFDDAADFSLRLKDMINRYMTNHVRREQLFRFYPYYRVQGKENGELILVSERGFRLAFKNLPYIDNVVALMTSGELTAGQIAAQVAAEKDCELADVFFTLNHLYDYGVIDETPPAQACNGG